MTDTIICPNCGSEIAVSETLAAQIQQHLRLEFDQEARRKDKDLEKRLEDLRQQERDIKTVRQSMEQEVSIRIAQEQTRLANEARVNAEQSVALEMRDLEGQLTEARDKIIEARKAELQLRQERRDLEDARRELELTVSRRLDQEWVKVRDEAKREAVEENRLREADKEKLVFDLRRQIEELKRMSELGSQQAQGEVLELELEHLLRQNFPFDIIEAVPRSTRGGDVLQHVHDRDGLIGGTIVWESKRTRAWNDAWLPKLRDDQRAAKAHLAVILTAELPKNLAAFGCIDGIWVTNRACLVGLGAALRAGLIEAARTRRSVEGRQTKVEHVYQYLAGTEFRQKVEGIAEAFLTMQRDLESEKRSLRRLWAKREKQLERAVVNTAGLYGDLGGIIGASLPRIPCLELPGITADEEITVATALENAPF